ncbi:MAG: nucleotidyltransferase domain-containing protein [Candidatus Moranbacteria bacterium]|jgi:predicted nucleotidyltransferase|nr:nucleotidyltransferase domain-containing protein [Candidatus Moranbacteria bacterium]MDX9856002.1 nucleotidyltransferase domain-containing protein [Candidatus Moranbacteria bacterium]
MNINDVNNLVKKFTKSFISEHESVDIEGILLFGSAVDEKHFNQHSDVDLYVVIKNIGKRYRGVKNINGIEIDYFVNPIKQLREDFEAAKIINKKTVLSMLADGKIIQDKDSNLQKLKEEAKNELKKISQKKMTDHQIFIAKYFIKDYLNDIKDSSEVNNIFAWQRNISLLLNYLVDTFCAYHGILIAKPKYQKELINSADPKFLEIYEEIASVHSRADAEIMIKKLSKYVLDDMGGALENDWELESDI